MHRLGEMPQDDRVIQIGTLKVKIGDIVQIIDGGPNDKRNLGTVIRFDIYTSESLPPEEIVEVMWADSHAGWILKYRLKMISACEETMQSGTI